MTTRFCPHDSFPMVRIDNRWECIVEYLNSCIGQQPVTDVVQRGDITSYVFENAHELPLLCFCCGSLLVSPDLEREREDIRGRRLEAMSWDTAEVSEGKEAIEFHLEFSPKGIEREGIWVAVALEVAARLKHPAHCLRHKKLPFASHHPQNKKKKKRR